MISDSLGILLKRFRTQKGLSQNDLAFAMGWSEASRLSRIEQGNIQKPSRQTLDRLIAILKLTRAERGQILLAGGYLPTQEEINSIRTEAQQMFGTWDYPTYIVDFAWRLLAWNDAAAKIYRITEKDKIHIYQQNPCSFELIFSHDFYQNKYLPESEKLIWQQVLLQKLIRFKINNQTHTSEKWYQDLFHRMIKNPLFASLWQQAQIAQEEQGIANYEYKVLMDVEDHSKRLEFHILRSPLLQDVRYEINYHIPGNLETMQLYSQ